MDEHLSANERCVEGLEMSVMNLEILKKFVKLFRIQAFVSYRMSVSFSGCNGCGFNTTPKTTPFV